MICSVHQKFLILMAKHPDKANYYRRRLRAHVEKCKFCQKHFANKK